MKKTLLAALAGSVIFVACNNQGNKTVTNLGGFVINGTVNELDTGWVYFGHSDSVGFIKDSVRVKDHQFSYTGKVVEPMPYYVWLHQARGEMMNMMDFFVEDTTIQMNINKDSLGKSVITGSHTEDLYLKYKEVLKPVRAKMDVLNKSYGEASQSNNKAMIDSLEKAYYKLSMDEIDAVASYIQSNPGSIVGAWAVKKMLYNFDVKLVRKLYTEFSPSVQQTNYGKEIKKELDIMERIAIGQMAPGFTQNDTTGKPVSLSSFHGKYVLVDFWASWCGPCRRENPNVVAAYKKFKDKNFTILGVSLDENKASWEKAINDDGLGWTEVSDLKAWKNAVAVDYGIRAIPSNFLLDPNGKIVGHNLRGEELQDTLAKVLK